MTTFAHDMLRETYEQPEALRRTLALYLADGGLNAEVDRRLAAWYTPRGEILIAASGSSRHSGLAAEILLEDLCGLAVDVEYASEYSCRGGRAFDNSPSGESPFEAPRNPLAGPLTDSPYGALGDPPYVDVRHPGLLVLSQSGETSDTLAALRTAARRGEKTLAITNAALSTMAIEADVSMPLAAGVEKAIPATKSFTCQLAVLYLLALYEGVRRGRMNSAKLAARIRELLALPTALEAQLDAWREQGALLAGKYKSSLHVSLSWARHPLRDRARRRVEAEGSLLRSCRGLPVGRIEARAKCARERQRATGRAGNRRPRPRIVSDAL